jgi:hypothetical protein
MATAPTTATPLEKLDLNMVINYLFKDFLKRKKINNIKLFYFF